ncbi:MAG: Rieske 2Fe-2S domain-containing protein [Chloroherpetonaceae bacterium]
MNLSRRKFIEHAALGAVAMVAPTLVGCGDNISSESSSKKIPNPPTNLQTTESLRYVMLTWDAPHTNTDGSPLVDLRSFLIYRQKPPDTEFRFLSEVEHTGTIFIDAAIGASEVAYQVIAKTKFGEMSEPSAPSTIARAQLIIQDNNVPQVGEWRLYDASGMATQEPTSALVSIERISKSEFFALELVCTHAGCGGMNFLKDIWSCRCHGSRFNRQGNVVQPPAIAPLTRLSAALNQTGGLTIRI